MALAVGRDLHIDQNLTDVAVAYRPQGMVADMIAPIVPVAKETNVYPVFSQGEALAVPNTFRARGTRAQKITRSVSSGNYSAKNYALAYPLYIEDMANMDDAFVNQLGIGATQILTDGLALDWEKRVMGLVGSASNVATGFLCGSSWSVGGNPLNNTAGDPISQIYKVLEQQNTVTAGYQPNSLLFGWKAWSFFKRNPNVRNFLLGLGAGAGRGQVTRQAVQDAFEVERLLVSNAFINNANEAQTASFINPFPADAVLAYYAPMAPSISAPSFMYSFRWTSPELGQPFAVFRHPYDTHAKTEEIEAGYYQDEKIVGSSLGHLLLGVGSAQATGLT